MNLLIIWWILSLLLVKVEALDKVCLDEINRICECFKPSKTTLSIECCGDKIIRFEWEGVKLLYELTGSSCQPPISKSSSCLTRGQGFSLKLTMYSSCSGKKRCNVTVHPSSNIKLQIPAFCEPATRIFTFIGNPSSNFTNTYPIFNIAGKNYIGKQISYNCTANTASNMGYLDLTVFYIHLGSKSCDKVKMISKGVPTFGLGCTDYGVTMFYRYVGVIGKEFRLEIDDLELEKNEIIYLRLGAGGYNISVDCHGNLEDTTETPTILHTTNGATTLDSTIGVTEKSKIISSSTPSTISRSVTENNEFSTGRTENSKMVDGEGDEVNPYALFGGILAALIVINIVCIGIYCFLRNRKRPKETTTNIALSNRKGKNSDHSHYNYVDIDGAQVTNSNNNHGQISNTGDKVSRPVYHELEIEDQKTTNEKSSNYDHIVRNKLPSGDLTPVCKSDNYDHIKSTSLQAVINDPYNHIGEDIQNSDHNGITAKGHNPRASNSGNLNQVNDDTYNHLNN